jgi:hypothetical protein
MHMDHLRAVRLRDGGGVVRRGVVDDDDFVVDTDVACSGVQRASEPSRSRPLCVG